LVSGLEQKKISRKNPKRRDCLRINLKKCLTRKSNDLKKAPEYRCFFETLLFIRVLTFTPAVVMRVTMTGTLYQFEK
jgi:hypothetical protein